MGALLVDVKHCPFCGSSEIEFGAFSFSEDCTVECKKCGVGFCKQVPWEGMTIKQHDKKCFDVLTDLWNTRI